MWVLDYKEGWVLKNWCFWTVVLEKTLENSLGLQGDQTSQAQRKPILNIHWKDWCWSWSSNTLTTWCKELTHWKRPWCWERLKVGGEGVDRGWDDWMESPTWWTWVWASSKRCSEGQESLVCCSPWGCKESDTTDRLNNNMLIVIEYGRPLLSNSLFHIWWIILKLSHLSTSWTSKTLATWCKELTHWKRPWCWERLEAEGEEGDRGWANLMALLTQWTWTWANSRRWWGTRKPGMLQSMKSQRARHDLVTEWQQVQPYCFLLNISFPIGFFESIQIASVLE